MYNSKEIRWFYKKEPESIRNWFEEHGYIFENTKARTDYYLPLKDKKDLSIKLRENNIEVKQRTSRSEKTDLTESIQGHFENYTKWSFSSAEDDSLFHEITEKEKYSWLAVKKERIGFKLKKDDHDEIVRVALEEFPAYGCQLEYTRVKIKQEVWYSFALEWFGEQEIRFDISILDEIIGMQKLEASDSMGYAEFLNKF